MRIRLNNEKREKLFRVARNHRMNDLTDKKLELFKQAKENVVNDMPQFFDIAKTIVERSYPKDDVATLQTFKIKYGSPLVMLLQKIVVFILHILTKIMLMIMAIQ